MKNKQANLYIHLQIFIKWNQTFNITSSISGGFPGCAERAVAGGGGGLRWALLRRLVCTPRHWQRQCQRVLREDQGRVVLQTPHKAGLSYLPQLSLTTFFPPFKMIWLTSKKCLLWVHHLLAHLKAGRHSFDNVVAHCGAHWLLKSHRDAATQSNIFRVINHYFFNPLPARWL